MSATPDLRCPKCGMVSTDGEFCSECGAPMAAAAAPVPGIVPAGTTPGGAERGPPVRDATVCPDCGQPRPGPLARFCDNCRYDFVAGRSFSATLAPAGQPPAPPPSSPPPPPPPSAVAVVAPPPDAVHDPAPSPAAVPGSAAAISDAGTTGAAAGLSLRWDLIVAVDPSLRKPEDPDPTDLRERIFPLDLGDCLIGRRSDKEDIHPEIPIGDPGISRRHARLMRQSDGSIAVLDLGSMNGTRLNGAAIEPNILTPFAATDQVTLGCWTRLTLRPR